MKPVYFSGDHSNICKVLFLYVFCLIYVYIHIYRYTYRNIHIYTCIYIYIYPPWNILVFVLSNSFLSSIFFFFYLLFFLASRFLFPPFLKCRSFLCLHIVLLLPPIITFPSFSLLRSNRLFVILAIPPFHVIRSLYFSLLPLASRRRIKRVVGLC